MAVMKVKKKENTVTDLIVYQGHASYCIVLTLHHYSFTLFVCWFDVSHNSEKEEAACEQIVCFVQGECS